MEDMSAGKTSSSLITSEWKRLVHWIIFFKKILHHYHYYNFINFRIYVLISKELGPTPLTPSDCCKFPDTVWEIYIFLKVFFFSKGVMYDGLFLRLCPYNLRITASISMQFILTGLWNTKVTSATFLSNCFLL